MYLVCKYDGFFERNSGIPPLAIHEVVINKLNMLETFTSYIKYLNYTWLAYLHIFSVFNFSYNHWTKVY